MTTSAGLTKMPTALEIVSLYLWGQKNKPSPDELTSDKWIRPLVHSNISIDSKSYMKDSAGRFATPDRFKILTNFFNKDIEIEPGFYTYNEIWKTIYGNSASPEKLILGLSQYELGNKDPDFIDRAYVFGSTQFELLTKITSNTTTKEIEFIVNQDGSREVRNLKIVPLNDNFDYASTNGFAKITNSLTEPLIDPSDIGRTVNINFTDIDNIPVIDNLTEEMFRNYEDQTQKQNEYQGNISYEGSKAFAELMLMLNSSGIIDYLDQDHRKVLYDGDNQGGALGERAFPKKDENYSDAHGNYGYDSYTLDGKVYPNIYRAFRKVSLIGGSSNDILVGGYDHDLLIGNEGNDILDGGDGFDIYYADNNDTIIDSDGEGKVFIDGKLLTGGERDKKNDSGRKPYVAEDGTEYHWSGDDLIVNGVTIRKFKNNTLGINLTEKDDEEPDIPPPTIDPLVIDMNGDGVKTLSRDNGVYFDLDNNGFKERTGWIDQNDAFLALDRNNNGQIDNGNELFGTYTSLSGGGLADNGFNALADFDLNRDGMLDESDKIWSALKLWQDRNSNGVVDASELTDIINSDLIAIKLNHQAISETDEQGNSHRKGSQVIRRDNSMTAIEEIWFDVSLADTRADISVEIPEEIKLLPNVRGFGNVHALHTAMTLDTELAKKVRNYVTAPANEQPALLDELIYHWINSADIKPNARTNDFDSRKLITLEKIAGQQINVQRYLPSTLLAEYERFSQYVAAQLKAQTVYKDIFASVILQYDSALQTVAYDWSQFNRHILSLFERGEYVEINTLTEIANNLGNYSSSLKNHYVYNLDATSKQGSELNGSDKKDTLIGTGRNDILRGGYGNDVLYGGAGNDTLYGGSGSDLFIFDKDWGQDNVDEWSSYDDINTLLFNNISPDELLLRNIDGNMMITRLGSEDNVTIKTQFINYQSSSIGRIAFSDGTNWNIDTIRKMAVKGTARDDVILGITNNDIIYASSGNDIVTGNGKIYGEEGDDRLFIKNSQVLSEGSLLSGGAGDDILNAGEGTLIFTDYPIFAEDGIMEDDREDSTKGIQINIPTNILDGGIGNDILFGSFDNEIYYFDIGFGQDQIYERREGQNYRNVVDSYDIVRFGEGIMPSDIHYIRIGDDLILQHINDIDRITVYNHFKGPNNHYKINAVEFVDGTLLSAEQFESQVAYFGTDGTENIFGQNHGETIYGLGGDDYIAGRGGNDKIFGGAGNDRLSGDAGSDILDGGEGDDHYYYYAGSGQDIIDQRGGGKDILFTNDVAADRLSFRKDNNDLLVIIDKDEMQSVRVKNHFLGGEKAIWGVQPNGGYTITASEITSRIKAQEAGGNYSRVTEGTENADSLKGSSGSDFIRGLAGNDNLFGFSDNDRLEGGDGNDYLSGGNGKGVGSGNDILIGGNGNDTLYGEDGNDILMGGTGKDSYLYYTGDGIDVIKTGGGDDILFFRKIESSRLSFHRSEDDLVVLVDKDIQQQVRVLNHFQGGEYALGGIQPENSYTLNVATIDKQLTKLPQIDDETSRSLDNLIIAMATFDNYGVEISPVSLNETKMFNSLLTASNLN